MCLGLKNPSLKGLLRNPKPKAQNPKPLGFLLPPAFTRLIGCRALRFRRLGV